MPLDTGDHFDFEKVDKSVDFNGDNIENIKTESGDINIGGYHSGYMESKTGNVEVHRSNSGGIELGTGNITIHGENSGSISSKIGYIKVWGENKHVIETGLGNIYVRDNKGTIITESGTIFIGNLDIKILKNTASSMITKDNRVKLSNLLTVGKKKKLALKKEEYIVSVGGYKIDYNNKQITTDGIECQSNKNFDGDTIRFNYMGQTIIVMKNRVLVSPENEEEEKENKEEKKEEKGALDNNIRKYIK